MKAFIKKFFENVFLSTWFKKKAVHVFIGCVLLFVVLHMSYSVTLFDYPYDYNVGDIVSEDIVLEQDYFDEVATRELKDKVQYEVEEIFALDLKVYAQAKESIAEFYKKAYEIRSEYLEEEAIKDRVFAYLLRGSFDLNEEELKLLGSMDDVDLRLTESYIYDILKTILKSDVNDENIIEKKQEAFAYFDRIEQMDESIKPVIKKIVDYHIIANSHLDEEATKQAVSDAQKNVEDVVILAGTLLIEAGQPLDQRTYDILNQLGLNDLHTFEQNIPLLSMDAVVILLLATMYVVVLFYVNKQEKSIKFIYLDFTVVILVYLLAFGLRSISIYLIPLALVSMLISIIDNDGSGVVFGIFTTLLFGTIFSLPATLIALTLVGCMLSAILVRQVHQRGKIFLAGVMVSLINGLMISGYLLIVQPNQFVFEYVWMGLLSGVLCSMITIGTLPVWETVFRVLTPLKLLELSNPNHPLMKKLLLEAPGTYHHSILVANLSEAAVHDIGGNGILARVGAYFHDIGKLEKPYFFVENQFDNNPHDQLVPMVSAKIIREHVTKGIALGKQYKLHKEVLSFIEEHHGTTMIKYFYHKASENQDNVDIDPSTYTYEGPIPQSKETAVVMLADSVEAAVRSMKQGDIKGLISKIIDDKIKSHQLDESGLTYGDVEVIKSSFYSNLSSAFHERIEYPEAIQTPATK